MRNVCITKFKKFFTTKDDHLESGGNTVPPDSIQYLVCGNEICPKTKKKH